MSDADWENNESLDKLLSDCIGTVNIGGYSRKTGEMFKKLLQENRE